MPARSFTIARDVFYGLIAAASTCVMGFAAVRVAHIRHRPGRLNPYLVPLIAASFSMVFLLPRYLLCRFNRLTGVLSHLWVEIVLLWSASVIYLFGAGYEAWNMEGVHCVSERCHRALAMEALSWVSWGCMVILMTMLVSNAIIERRSGKVGVLTNPVAKGKTVDDDAHEGDFGMPMATKGEGFAGREV